MGEGEGRVARERALSPGAIAAKAAHRSYIRDLGVAAVPICMGNASNVGTWV